MEEQPAVSMLVARFEWLQLLLHGLMVWTLGRLEADES